MEWNVVSYEPHRRFGRLLSRSQGTDVMSDPNWFVCIYVDRVSGLPILWTILNIAEVEYETSE